MSLLTENSPLISPAPKVPEASELTGAAVTLHHSARFLVAGDGVHAAASVRVQGWYDTYCCITELVRSASITPVTVVGWGRLGERGEIVVFVTWNDAPWCIRLGADPDDDSWGGVPGTLVESVDGEPIWVAPDWEALASLGDPYEVLDVANSIIEMFTDALDAFGEADASDVANATLGLFSTASSGHDGTSTDDVNVLAWRQVCARVDAGPIRLYSSAPVTATPRIRWEKPSTWSYRTGTQSGPLAEAGVPPAARVLSLGAGTQSTALALAMCEGLVPGTAIRNGVNVEDGIPFRIVFADTGAENPGTYRHLHRLAEHLGSKYSQTIDVVSAGNLAVDQVAHCFAGTRGSNPPWWVLGAPKGDDTVVAYDRKVGMLGKRTCTETFKKDVLIAFLRSVLGAGPGERVPKERWLEQAYGMSRDEAVRRMRDPGKVDRWAVYTYPLTDPLDWSREDSVRYLEREGFSEVPRSACVFCPLIHNRSGVAFTRQVVADVEGWLLAAAVDSAIRSRMKGVNGRCFVHRDAVPLPRADLRSRAEMAADSGQGSLFEEDDDLLATACSSSCFT